MDGLFFFIGTWRSVLVAGAEHFIKISKNIPVEMAATISVNPTTAYRMMKAFVPLKPGKRLFVCLFVLFNAEW